ncbi:nucleotide sugar dehydrogenase [Streptomyces sp. NPDC001787]|uniref:nucleotide sugar dehydrogenase n=1 Tax=Streptomyces sp. NPDC001787 TaxID=3154523 RepID=UPI003320B326
MPDGAFSSDVVIIGGCGRVGLPLGIALASRGRTVSLYDINEKAVEQVNEGRLPFLERGAEQPLADAVREGQLMATVDPAVVGTAEYVIVVVGTPVDAFLAPDHSAVWRALESCRGHFSPEQVIVLRSTVHPGAVRIIERLLEPYGLASNVAFCPERIAEGHSMTELFSLPQIVAARNQETAVRAEKLFRALTDRIVSLSPEEAELVKLFTNSWRYIKFATANEFWRISNDAGLDYDRIRHALTHEYPRAADVPGAGFAAGPCLRKDTIQLASHSGTFALGHAAVQVNEGLPAYLVSRLERRYPLADMTVGILGMGFKAGSDDPRESLSFRLRKILLLRAQEVLCADPYVVDERFLPEEEVLGRADLLIIGAPHPAYHGLKAEQPIADVWGITGHGALI